MPGTILSNSTRTRSLLQLVVVVLAGLTGHAEQANAAVFCVADAAGFGQALQEAAANEEDNQIRLVHGMYSAPAGGWTIDLQEGKYSLDIFGGFVDADCQQRQPNATLTVLDGNHTARPLTIETSGSDGSAPEGKRIHVSGLTFRNGYAPVGSGLKISDPGPIYGGTILIEGNIFRNNVATAADFSASGALQASTDGPSPFQFGGPDVIGLVVRNNLFVGNEAPNVPAMLLFSNNRIAVGNNTVVGNRLTDDGSGERLAARFITLTGTTLSNNVFWGNTPDGFADVYDLRLDNDNKVALVNNCVQRRIGAAVSETGTLNLDPAFADAPTGDYSPSALSPLADAGVDDSPAGIPLLDVVGRERFVGNHVDIGAYERQLDMLFTNGFDGP